MKERLNEVEKVLQSKLPEHTASVKSAVIALMEVAKYARTREAERSQQWEAVELALQ